MLHRHTPRRVGPIGAHRLFAFSTTLALATAATFLCRAPHGAARAADDVPLAAAVAVVPATEEAARERAAGRAIERGLTWLAAEWEKGGIDKPEKAEETQGRGNIAAAAIAGLAFLQDGAEPGKGRHGAALQQCLDFITRHADAETGLISAGTGAGGPMYGHGFATFFLAEAYARTRDDKLKEKVVAAERLIERSQNTLGGWRYLPKPLDADVSVTSCQLTALRAAQRAGIDVDQKVIDRGLKFLATCQRADGGFGYMPNGGGVSGPTRTAAATAVMSHHGVRGASFDKAVAYLLKVGRDGRPGPGEGFISYDNFYASQVIAGLPGAEARTRLYAPLRDRIVARQAERGAWDGDISPEYGTASAVFALQVPDSRLNLLKPEKDPKPAGEPRKSDAGKGDKADD